MISVQNFKEAPTKEEILKVITQEQIFMRYLGVLNIGTPILSPFRNESKPSFSLFYDSKGILRYKDFGTGQTGDCFDFVANKFNISWKDVLQKISNELERIRHIDNPVVSKISNKQQKGYYNTPNKLIQIIKKDFDEFELNYWKQYGISPEILSLFNVYSAAHVYINGGPFLTSVKNNPIFAYYLNGAYKIYRPLADSAKWLSNLRTTDIFGYDQLPLYADRLIITKSLKDVMVLRTLGYLSISPQSESQYNFMENETWLSLQKRFKKISILYDCDRAGYTNAKKLSNYYKIPAYFVQNNLCILNKNSDTPKDISDYFVYYGEQATKTLLNELYN